MEQIFDDATFQEKVIKASQDKPVLVDFWASWCGPCRMQGPIIEELATELDDEAIVGKMDVETNQATPMQYEVRGIPSLKIFRNGRVVQEFVGVTPKDTLSAALRSHK